MDGAVNRTTRPPWLNKKIDLAKCGRVQKLLKSKCLNTVCREAMCPNISECFEAGVATFLILGNVCTRSCLFCGVRKGRTGDLDPDEPRRVAGAVEELGLRHAVVTSVTRDDLEDGGASAFCDTIREIRKIGKDIAIEVLVPDFRGKEGPVASVLSAGPDIFAHNVETVPRIYRAVRPEADFERSLAVLETSKRLRPDIKTKSGFMLGLSEKEDEVLEAMKRLREADCDFLSIGQYLAPSKKHYPVREYVDPEVFISYREKAVGMGFKYVESGPYVRSSYMAGNYLR